MPMATREAPAGAGGGRSFGHERDRQHSAVADDAYGDISTSRSRRRAADIREPTGMGREPLAARLASGR